MLHTLTEEEIESLLHQQYIGHLGCHADELTYVVPISYAYDGTYLYGHAYAGMKIDMMKKNPKVCFQVDNIVNPFSWKSVIAWGDFEELHSETDRLHVQKMMMGTSPAFLPPDINAPDIILFRIGLTKKTGCYNKAVQET